MFAEMADTLSSLPLDTLPLPYSVDGDTLILSGFIAFSRFDDGFDYSNPDSNSCAQETTVR